MFFRNKPARTTSVAAEHVPHAAAQVASPPSSTSDDGALRVLDALGHVLQSYGANTFDTDVQSAEEAQELVREWLRHLTIGTARPGSPEGGQISMPLAQRDWTGFGRFFSEQRRGESQYVTNALKELRTAIWEFVHRVHQVVIADESSNRTTSTVLDRVRGAVNHGSLDVIRREVLQAVTSLEETMEQRREKQRSHYKELARAIDNLGQQLEEARRESNVDPLTGLENRKGFDAFVTRLVQLNALSRRPACLLMIDLDFFKDVNDAHGHPAGDAMLRRVADTLSRIFLRNCDLVSRYGGDEFAVVLQDTEGAAAEVLATRLLTAMRELKLPSAKSEISLSIGIAPLSPGDDVEGWTRRADQALYRAKHEGRGRVEIAAD
jgi:diguanylate cyclase (GGDEF)-like protein